MKHIDIEFIQVSADKGVIQGNALMDAIILSANEWKNVRLTFNGRIFHIRVNDLLASVTEEGGEKPENIITKRKYEEDICKMANAAHNAIGYVGAANYSEREREAHQTITKLEKELLS